MQHFFLLVCSVLLVPFFIFLVIIPKNPSPSTPILAEVASFIKVQWRKRSSFFYDRSAFSECRITMSSVSGDSSAGCSPASTPNCSSRCARQSRRPEMG
jgi:hypothetical protein